MSRCFSEPRESSHRREGKNCLAGGLTFRSQVLTLPLSPSQAESNGHCTVCGKAGSVSWTLEEGERGRSKAWYACFSCLPAVSLERVSDSIAGHRKCEERKGGLGTCVCLSVFTSNLLLLSSFLPSLSFSCQFQFLWVSITSLSSSVSPLCLSL